MSQDEKEKKGIRIKQVITTSIQEILPREINKMSTEEKMEQVLKYIEQKK